VAEFWTATCMLSSPGVVGSLTISVNLQNSNYYEILYVDRGFRDERSGF
jgi:hypothetical protein